MCAVFEVFDGTHFVRENDEVDLFLQLGLVFVVEWDTVSQEGLCGLAFGCF
jgi:hypothetical protein